MEFSTLQRQVHQTAKDHGWHEKPRGIDMVPTWLMLIVSELSEALEVYREGHHALNTIYYSVEHPEGKPEGFAVELADAVIRLMDMAEALSIDLETAIKLKNAYNETRPYRHGGKVV